MSIWIALWLVLSSILLLFMGWMLYILIMQKAVWKAFAKKYKLRYKTSAIMQPPDMDGVVHDYKMSFFPSEHVAADMRGVRRLTAIEISLNSTLPIDGTIASGGMVQIAQAIGFKAELRPEYKGWNKSYIAVTDNKYVLDSYLTPERLDVLTRLMKVKNAWVMLIFRKETMLLRLDLPDPLISEVRLEKIKEMILKTAEILELKKGEGERLKTEILHSAAQNIALETEEEMLSNPSSLSLEEDTEPETKPEEEPDPKTKAKAKPKK